MSLSVRFSVPPPSLSLSAVLLTRALGEDRLSCLHSAAKNGQNELISFLLYHGADVNVASFERHVTPLMMAVEGKHFETTKLLLAAGANVKSKTSDDPGCS